MPREPEQKRRRKPSTKRAKTRSQGSSSRADRLANKQSDAFGVTLPISEEERVERLHMKNKYKLSPGESAEDMNETRRQREAAGRGGRGGAGGRTGPSYPEGQGAAISARTREEAAKARARAKRARAKK